MPASAICFSNAPARARTRHPDSVDERAMTSYLLAIVLAAQFGQVNTGELRVTVTDSAGLPLQSVVDLVSEANQVRQRLETDVQGTLVARRLPFGTYRLAVTRDGFAAFSDLVEIRSAVPAEYRVTLSLAPIQTQVTVSADDTLIDSHQTMTVHRIGSDDLQQRL